jgi:hypothetical protein
MIGQIDEDTRVHYESIFSTVIFKGVGAGRGKDPLIAGSELKKKRVRKFTTISIEIKLTIHRLYEICLREIALGIEYLLKRAAKTATDATPPKRVVVDTEEGVIIVTSPDFQYPSDISFFETIFLTAQRFKERDNLSFLRRAFCDEMRRFFAIRVRQVLESIFAEEISASQLFITDRFINGVGETFAAYLREISLRIFKYSKATTNGKNTCTITRNVFSLIMDMDSFDTFYTLNQKMSDEISRFAIFEKEKATRRNSSRPRKGVANATPVLTAVRD